MKKRNYLLIVLLLSVLISCNCKKKTNELQKTTTMNKAKQTETTSKVTIIFDNDHCNIKEAKNVVIQDEKELKAIYAKINMTRRPGVPVPKIDFEKETVYGIFLGEKSNAGYKIKFDKVVNFNDKTIIYYKVISPKGMASMVITQPCLLGTIPKTEVPVKFVLEN